MIDSALIFHWFLPNGDKLGNDVMYKPNPEKIEIGIFLEYAATKSNVKLSSLRLNVLNQIDALTVRGRNVKGFTLAIKGEAMGFAFCSGSEANFNRKRGVQIAMGRLNKKPIMLG